MSRSRILVLLGVLLMLGAVAVITVSPKGARSTPDDGSRSSRGGTHAGKSTLDSVPGRQERPTGRPLEESEELRRFEAVFAEWQDPAQRTIEDLEAALNEAIGALTAEEAGWYARRWMRTEFAAAQKTSLLTAMFSRWADGELTEATETAYQCWSAEPGGSYLTELLDTGLRRAVVENPDLVREIYRSHYGDPPRAVDPEEELPALKLVNTALQP